MTYINQNDLKTMTIQKSKNRNGDYIKISWFGNLLNVGDLKVFPTFTTFLLHPVHLNVINLVRTYQISYDRNNEVYISLVLKRKEISLSFESLKPFSDSINMLSVKIMQLFLMKSTF